MKPVAIVLLSVPRIPFLWNRRRLFPTKACPLLRLLRCQLQRRAKVRQPPAPRLPPPPPARKARPVAALPASALPRSAALRHNTVHSATAFGGLIGGLIRSKKKSLEEAVSRINASGYEVVCVLPESVPFLVSLLYSIILGLTLFMICPSPGYIIIARQR